MIKLLVLACLWLACPAIVSASDDDYCKVAGGLSGSSLTDVSIRQTDTSALRQDHTSGYDTDCDLVHPARPLNSFQHSRTVQPPKTRLD